MEKKNDLKKEKESTATAIIKKSKELKIIFLERWWNTVASLISSLVQMQM